MTRRAPGSGGGVAPPMWRSYKTSNMLRDPRVNLLVHSLPVAGPGYGQAMHEQVHPGVTEHVAGLVRPPHGGCHAAPGTRRAASHRARPPAEGLCTAGVP